QGMSVLATIGSVAPFVGLLGTVVGIITAFTGIATTGSGGLGAVSAGIAEALIETALGLVVAKGGVKSDINVTPLVDVMLVLLIIMMVIAPMLQQGVPVTLPSAANST